MPPKRAQKPGGGVVIHDACAFCHRGADATVPGALAALVAFDAAAPAAPRFHEACAALSARVARERPAPGALPTALVSIELLRGRSTKCGLCGRPGATLACCQRGCAASYHLPCAREAAMGTLRVGGGLRPTFAAPAPAGSDAVAPALACGAHAGCVATPLQEPAGLWFEACGGWAFQLPSLAAAAAGAGDSGAAAGEPNGTGSSDPTREHCLEKMGSTVGAAAPAAAPIPTPAEPAPAKPPVPSPGRPGSRQGADAEATSFHIPGYDWERSACLLGPPPPLRPGEVRALGVTLSAPVAAAYRAATSAFADAAAWEKLRPVVVLAEEKAPLTRSVQKAIAEGLKRAISKATGGARIDQVGPDLPAHVPCHPALEAFIIPRDDPRRGLAVEGGAMGVRVNAGAAPLKPGDVLGVYGGLQVTQEDSIRMLSDEALAAASGFRCRQQLATKLESYAAEEQLVMRATADEAARAHAPRGCQVVAPEVAFARAATEYRYDGAMNWLVTNAWLYGNVTCLINDPLVDPFGPGGGVGDGDATVAPSNCRMITCLVRGWPFTVLVATAAVPPGQELLYLYSSEDPGDRAYWDNLQTFLKDEAHALAALDEAERAEAEKAALRAENEALRAALEAAKGGSSGAAEASRELERGGAGAAGADVGSVASGNAAEGAAARDTAAAAAAENSKPEAKEETESSKSRKRAAESDRSRPSKRGRSRSRSRGRARPRSRSRDRREEDRHRRSPPRYSHSHHNHGYIQGRRSSRSRSRSRSRDRRRSSPPGRGAAWRTGPRQGPPPARDGAEGVRPPPPPRWSDRPGGRAPSYSPPRRPGAAPASAHTPAPPPPHRERSPPWNTPADAQKGRQAATPGAATAAVAAGRPGGKGPSAVPPHAAPFGPARTHVQPSPQVEVQAWGFAAPGVAGALPSSAFRPGAFVETSDEE